MFPFFRILAWFFGNNFQNQYLAKSSIYNVCTCTELPNFSVFSNFMSNHAQNSVNYWWISKVGGYGFHSYHRLGVLASLYHIIDDAYKWTCMPSLPQNRLHCSPLRLLRTDQFCFRSEHLLYIDDIVIVIDTCI